DLVCACVENRSGIIQSAYPAAHREGNKYLTRGSAHRLQERGAFLVCCSNVEQNNLIRTSLAVGEGKLRGVSRIAQVHELRAFHDAPGVHIETSDNAFGQHEIFIGSRSSPVI